MKTPTPEDIQAVAADPTLRFCWFSWKQLKVIERLARGDGRTPMTPVYKSPEGKEYTITHACESPTRVPGWPDVEYLGVGHWDHLKNLDLLL